MASISGSGSLSALGAQYDVLSSDKQTDYPCMDTNYRNVTWSFVIMEKYNSFAALMAAEEAWKSKFADRDPGNVSYKGQTITDMLPTSISTLEKIPSATGTFYAKFRLEFKKENA